MQPCNLGLPDSRAAEGRLSILDLDRLRAAPLAREPFDFVLVEEFLRRDEAAALAAEFPAVGRPGSFPLDGLALRPAFTRLVAELHGPALRRAVAEKFAIDLEGRPTLLTLRARGDGRDGRIHTDSASKIVTLLLYMNPAWEAAGGRLRLLRGSADLDDYAVEVTPLLGTMLAFRRSERSFHGHHAHVGERRALQLNWVTDARVVARELGRHRWSARLKALNPFARIA